MEKRVTFRGWLLPLLLIAPQVLISAVFFFYPAGQAIWQSLFIPDPFGLSSQFVGLGNFQFLLGDPFYRASFLTTAIFSILVTLCSMLPALFLAVIADRLIKGSGVYRTMLIWPSAVAPADAGVLRLYMFNTRVGVISWYLGTLGYDWNHVLNGGEAMGLVVVASAWGRISYNFLFFFAALQAVPKSVIEAAAIDGARFWRRFFTIVLPLLSPTTFFLLVVNVVYAFFETFLLFNFEVLFRFLRDSFRIIFGVRDNFIGSENSFRIHRFHNAAAGRQMQPQFFEPIELH